MTPIPSATDMIKSCPGSFLRHFICFFSPRLVAEIPFSSGTRFWFSFFMSRIQLLDNLWYSILSHISQSYVQLFSVSFVRFLHIWCWLRGLLSQSRLRLWIALGWIRTQHILRSHRPLVSIFAYCLLCFCIPAGFLSSQTLQYRQSGNVRPGLFSDAAIIADGRFYRTHSNTR